MEAATICDLLGKPFEVHPPDEVYMHGWGSECAGARQVKCKWELTVMDNADWPVTLKFDLVEGRSPLIVGMDVKKFADTCNRATPSTLTFKRPNDVRVYQLYTYISNDATNNPRLRLEVVPHEKSCITTLMSATHKRREMSMAKRVHRFSHASVNDMVRLMAPTGFDKAKIFEACSKVFSACAICAASGRPADKRKVSTTHLNAAFNEEVQSDFFYVYIREKKYEILNMIDLGTRYGERAMTTSRSADEIKRMFEIFWFYRHGAPRNFSADHEFCRPVLKRFLDTHAIKLNPRPSRSSNKTGRVERNNGLFKMVLERLQKADTKATPELLIARTSFITNLLRGSKVMSAFQLARGFTPSILGIPRQIVSQELLDVHVERESLRALEKIMRSKTPGVLDKDQLAPGTDVFVYHKSSKHTEPNQWVRATVIEASEHAVSCRRRARGPPMSVSYNDIRLMPRGPLTQELMMEELADEEMERIICEPGMDVTDRQIIYQPIRTNPIPAKVSDNSNVNTSTRVTATDPSKEDEGNKKAPDTTRNGIQDDDALVDKLMTNPADTEIPEAGVMTAATQCTPLHMNGSSTNTPSNEVRKERHDKRTDKDIGGTIIGTDDVNGDLMSDEQKVLKEVHAAIGNSQVTLNKLESAPSWITDKSLKEEHAANWEDAYFEVKESTIPEDANVINSHVIYKLKMGETGTMRMKARICPHGNRDDQKDQIRKDSATAQFDVIRLLLAIVTLLPMRLGVLDISGAYMQSGPIKRDLYVRPPREWGCRRGFIWKLLKLPYGISEAGRQWAKVFEEWLITEMNMYTVEGVSQLFIKRRQDGSIMLMVAKVTDDLLIAADTETMREFIKKVNERFKVSKSVVDEQILFNGTRIMQDSAGNISMTMKDYMKSIKPITLSRARRKQAAERATQQEYRDYRSLAGSLIWAGGGTLPQAAFIASYMQQVAPRLRVHDLSEANKMLKELRDLDPTILFRKMNTAVSKIEVWTFSDASFNIVSGRDYGQTGVVTGLKAYGKNGENCFHLVDWTSSKQRRVSHSSYGAEILACADADDRGFYIKQAVRSITQEDEIAHVLHVDSRGLFDTISTLHDGKEYRLRQTVQRIRDSFESRDIDILRWVPTGMNVADSLTKRCPPVQRKFNLCCAAGQLTIDNPSVKQLVSLEWK